jgi:hypothetical protein
MPAQTIEDDHHRLALVKLCANFSARSLLLLQPPVARLVYAQSVYKL